MNRKPKFYITTTIPDTLDFFSGQPELWKQNFDVCAISSKREMLESWGKQEGIRTYFLDLARNPSPLKDLRSLLSFITLFYKDKPEIVHGGTPKASFLSMIAAWITRRPIRIYMCHGLRYQAFSGRYRKFLMLMEKITCKCATDVICVSLGTMQGLTADGICPPDKARVIGYGSACGIDLTHYSLDKNGLDSNIRKKIGISDDAYIYLFIGRVVHDKGISELIRSFTQIERIKKNVHFVILGAFYQEDDPIDEETMHEIKKNPCIHYMGQQTDVRPYLKAANIFVLPSYREGLSTVLVEAGAMGKASITSNVTGCGEIIENGKNGILISSPNLHQGGNPEQMCNELLQAMIYAYEHPSEIEQMGKMARKRIEERYEQQVVWQNYNEEYLRLAKRLKEK